MSVGKCWCGPLFLLLVSASMPPPLRDSLRCIHALMFRPLRLPSCPRLCCVSFHFHSVGEDSRFFNPLCCPPQ
jgi:hypothetical protein